MVYQDDEINPDIDTPINDGVSEGIETEEVPF